MDATNAADHQEEKQAYTGDAFRPGEESLPPVRPMPELEGSPFAKGVARARSALLPFSRGLHATRQFLWSALSKANHWSRQHGGPYWHTILYEEEVDASPYMTRIVWKRLRFHIFHRGDNDPDPHDHPWGFWTFPLVPYVEEVVVEAPWNVNGEPARQLTRRIVRAFRFHYRRADHTHRVLGAYAGKPERWTGEPATTPGKRIYTIVWRDGGVERDWGFLKNRDGKWCWQEWKIYHRLGGKHAPCED